MPQITDQVAKNRESTRRLDGRFVDLPETANRNLSFARNTIEVSVATVEIYTRSLNNSLVSGHPDPSHGSGRGVAGDVRGSWSLVESTVNAEIFTQSGRNGVRDSLDGQDGGGFNLVVIGTGTSTPGVGDTSLEVKNGETFAWGIDDGNAEVRARSHFLFAEDGLESSSLAEVGIVDGAGRLIARATVPATSVTEEEEVRVDVTLTVSGSGTGNSVITSDGEDVIADSIRSRGEAVGINEIRFGTGSTTPSKSDSSLAAEEYAQNALRSLSNESIAAEVVTDSSQPSSQPVDLTEIGVFDNASTPRLLWRTTMDTLEKTDAFGFRTTVSFRIV